MPQAGSQSSNTPAPPAGYTLDSAGGVPAPPSGYTLDNQATPPKGGGAGGSWGPPQGSLKDYANEAIQGVNRGVSNLVFGVGDMMKPRNPNEAQYGPTGRLLLHLGQDTSQGLKNAYSASSQSRASGEGLAGQALSFAENAPFVGGMVRHAEEGGTKTFSPQSIGSAVEGATYAVVPEIAKRASVKALNLPQDVSDFRNRAKSMNDITKAGTGVYQGSIQPIFQKLRGLIQNEGARTMQQAIEADKAAPSNKMIPVSAVTEVAKAINDTGYTPTGPERALLDRLHFDPAEKFAKTLGYGSAAEGKLAVGENVFNDAMAKTGNIPSGLPLDEATKLRTSIGGAASKAERAGNAKGARVLWTAYNELGENMAKRVEELQGSRAPFDHYNNEFKAYFELNKGTPGSMMENLADRHDSIPKLKEFVKADLSEVKGQMKKYGMDPSAVDKAQEDAKYVTAAFDSTSGIYRKSLYRMVMGGASAGTLALPIAIYAAAHGAGLYGLAPMLLASYFGSKTAGLGDEIKTGQILRKLSVKPEHFQVRTPVEGPQEFQYPGPSSSGPGNGGGGEPSPPPTPNITPAPDVAAAERRTPQSTTEDIRGALSQDPTLAALERAQRGRAAEVAQKYPAKQMPTEESPKVTTLPKDYKAPGGYYEKYSRAEKAAKISKARHASK